MTVPSILNLQAIAGIGAMVLMIVQYVKEPIPAKLVPVVSILVGIGISFLYFYQPGQPIDFVTLIANGILGAVSADTGFNFLSSSQSPPLSLSSKK